MSYKKQNWQSGDTITATKLNNMENGIESASSCVLAVNGVFDAGTETTTLDKTWQQIHDAPYAIMPFDDEGTLYMYSLYRISDSPYTVTFINEDGTWEFTADTADSYPTFTLSNSSAS